MGSVDVTAKLEPRSYGARPRRVGFLWPERLVGAVALAICLVYAVDALHPDEGRETQPESVMASLPTKPTWAPITKPIHLYSLDAAEIIGPPAGYEAQRHQLGGREDLLTFGRFDTPSPYLKLSIYRPQRDRIPASSFFLDVARSAADVGLWISHSFIASPLATRFGDFEAGEVAVGDSADRTNCLGFRFLGPGENLRITGLYCGTAMHPADRVSLTCLLNRLDLLSSGDDAPLRDFFVEAESRRSDGECLPARLADANPRTNWLEVGAARPSLKNGKSASRRTR
jgi:hypothetical protein